MPKKLSAKHNTLPLIHMQTIDASFKAFEEILRQLPTYEATIFSEQDTRVKIIDRILSDVLFVPFEDFQTEARAGRGYLDYRVTVKRSLPRLIIEAKRDGLDFGIDRSKNGRHYLLNGPVFKDDILKDGIEQAIYYCAFKSVELACVTNGTSWIVFRANRFGDGKDVTEGAAIVFDSLEGIRNEFKLFYDLLSYEALIEMRYRAIFQEIEGLTIRTKSQVYQLVFEGNIRMLERSEHSYDFDRIMNVFFSKLIGDDDPNLLLECFVHSKESEYAEKELLRVSEELAKRIRKLDTNDGELLVELIDRVKQSSRHEFVIIVGGKGAGKSTFVERFFKRVLPPNIKDDCIVIKVNLAESEGKEDTIVDWLNTNLLEETERILFEGAPTYDQLQGIFFHEYERLSKGPWKYLYDANKAQFKHDFGKHIEERREKKPAEHIKRLIGDITKSRKKVPCIIFDNTDHFSITFQEKVFQYARSIYEKEICLVIVPITEKTSWALSKQGAFQSFENESLYLPTPSPKKIIERRIFYIDTKVKAVLREKGDYFTSKGIRLKISDLAAFVASLQKILLNDLRVATWLGNLSNFDVRRCLELTRDLISSPYIPIDDLLKSFLANSQAEIRPGRVKFAIIKGFYTHYPINQHKFVQNLFYYAGNLDTSPIMSSRILQFLVDARNQKKKDDAFVSIEQTMDYFNGLGVPRQITLEHVDLLLNQGLIYNYDPTILEISEVKKIELSPSGKQHYYWSLYDNEYISCMLEVTAVTNESTFFTMKHCMTTSDNWRKQLVEFITYLLSEDQLYCLVPTHDAYKGQDVVTKIFRKRLAQLTLEIDQYSR